MYIYETITGELYCSRFRSLFGDGMYLGKAKTKAEARKLLKPYVETDGRRQWTWDYINNMLCMAFNHKRGA